MKNLITPHKLTKKKKMKYSSALAVSSIASGALALYPRQEVVTEVVTSEKTEARTEVITDATVTVPRVESTVTFDRTYTDATTTIPCTDEDQYNSLVASRDATVPSPIAYGMTYRVASEVSTETLREAETSTKTFDVQETSTREYDVIETQTRVNTEVSTSVETMREPETFTRTNDVPETFTRTNEFPETFTRTNEVVETSMRVYEVTETYTESHEQVNTYVETMESTMVQHETITLKETHVSYMNGVPAVTQIFDGQIQETDHTVVEKIPTTRLETVYSPSVVVRVNTYSTPITVSMERETPVTETQTRETPVVETETKETPVVHTETRETPVVETTHIPESIVPAVSQIRDGQIQEPEHPGAVAATTNAEVTTRKTAAAISQIHDGQIQATMPVVQHENGAARAVVGLGAGLAGLAALLF